MNTTRWTLLSPPNAELYEARLGLHWALQIPASANRAYIPAVPDQSHSNFEWHDEFAALMGKRTTEGFRSGLQSASLKLLVLDINDEIYAEKGLVGETLEQGYTWLTETLASFIGNAAKPLERPSYDLPDHPVASGKAFSHHGEYAELARWFANADAALSSFAASDEASPVRCWPHHMDIATLVTVEPHADPEKAKSVGVGMTPGDESISEPYWYATPWPYPSGEDGLPPLEGEGIWHTEGWVGALLKASDMMTNADQENQVKRFLDSALKGSKQLLA